MSKILITGTDTGVGKTLVTASILRRLINQNISVGALKPVETGCELVNGELAASDVEFLHLALQQSVKKEELIIEKFLSPVAPKVAAQFEEKQLNWAHLVKETTSRAKKFENFLIEGAGGLLVPITEDKTYADLALECDLSVIVVFGSKLGAINHAALTFEVLRARGIKTLGYIFNNLSPEPEQAAEIESAENSNRKLIAEVGEIYGLEELAYFPYCQDQADFEQILAKASLDKLFETLAWI